MIINDDQFIVGDPIINELLDESLKRLELIGKTYWESQLHEWEDLAKAEDSVQREYTGRYLFELLQNADDVLYEWREKIGVTQVRKDKYRVRIQLTQKALIVANDGLPFSEENVRALCRIHCSTKQASKQIGHKGIGFKSVLKISHQPEIYSGEFGFHFDKYRYVEQIRKIIGKDIKEIKVPTLKAPFPKRIKELEISEQEVIDLILTDGYQTVIRLPFSSKDIYHTVKEQINEDVSENLLLFLNVIDKIELKISGENDRIYSREFSEEIDSQGKEVTLNVESEGEKKPVSRWLLIKSKKHLIPDKTLVDGFGDAWQNVKYLRCSVAFPLTDDGKGIFDNNQTSNFHVYLPTDEYSGFKFVVNADFYIESARMTLRLNKINEFLLGKVVDLITNRGVKILKCKFPNEVAIIEALEPITERPQRDFSGYFYDKFLNALSKSNFVPIGKNLYRCPQMIRLAPKHANKELFRSFFNANYFENNDVEVAYPTIDVEIHEEERINNKKGFLTHDVMGAKRFDFESLSQLLDIEFLNQISEPGKFIKFLACWWEEFDYWKKNNFIDALSDVPIVPTSSGWQNPNGTTIYQANLREKTDINIPKGFGFEIVSLSAYGDDPSHEGLEARFLEKLGVKEYSKRSLIEGSILPKLTVIEEILYLEDKHPGAVISAYKMLLEYFEKGSSTDRFGYRLREIFVPSFQQKDPKKIFWKPAKEVYFSEKWIDNDSLEILFSQIPDAIFLSPKIGDLDLDEPETRDRWLKFFNHLSIRAYPRVIIWRSENSYESLTHYEKEPNLRFWEKYLTKYDAELQCKNPLKNHNASMMMRNNYSIEFFDDVI